jgi:DNA-binding IclR family transcriptional regulator
MTLLVATYAILPARPRIVPTVQAVNVFTGRLPQRRPQLVAQDATLPRMTAMSHPHPGAAVPSGDRAAASAAGVQSVGRAVQILEILARRGGAGVSEIAVDLGVHKSTVFRLLSALEEHGLVGQAVHRGKYQLGFGILRLASAVPGRLDLVRQGRPVCEDLAHSMAETVNLAVLRSHYAVNLDQVRGPAAVSAHNWVGQLTALHATSSGKILIAFLAPEEQSRLLDESGLKSYTPSTITSREELSRQLGQAREDGWAHTLGEYEVGLNAMAAPIRDHAGEIVGAVSVSAPAYRMDLDRMTALSAELVEGANRISNRLGYLG